MIAPVRFFVAGLGLALAAGCTRAPGDLVARDTAQPAAPPPPTSPAKEEPGGASAKGTGAKPKPPANSAGSPSPRTDVSLTSPRGDAWRRVTSPSPLAIARAVDKVIKGLKGTAAEVRYAMLLPETGMADGRVIVKIKDARTFQIQYPALVEGLPTTAVVRADGQRVGELVAGRPVSPGERLPANMTLEQLGWKVRPVGRPAAPTKPDQLVSTWVTRFPRHVFAGLIDGTNPFAAYVEAVGKGVGGYALAVEERQMASGAQVVRNYRIVAERPPQAARRLGEARVEIVVDADHFVPVTIAASERRPGATSPTQTSWTAAWASRQTFNGEDFRLPSR